MNLTFLYPLLRFDALAIGLSIACLFFSFLIGIYSFKFLRGKVNLFVYYTFFILTAIFSCLVFLANNLILLLICWGLLALTLYMLINISASQAAAATAKKTLIIVGATDSLMLLGIALIFYLSQTIQMDRIQIPLDCVHWFVPTFAYLCLAFASFAKAGVMPMHSWIPDCASDAYVPVTAYLPAALDKLLGIYLLFRISTSLFVMSQAMNTFLLAIGSLTIVAAVMMALIQADVRKTLAYLAVSSSGYMVLAVGTSSQIGIAGGLFYMLTSALCISCLFLCSGNIISRAHTADLDKLGGLAKTMPLTYMSALMTSLALSGVPPLNGFFSKWMIYQAIVKLSATNSKLWVIWLIAAMFGSSLTLASFMKIIHGVFLGQMSDRLKSLKISEVSWSMWLGPAILASVCVAFGLFARKLPLPYLILPASGTFIAEGFWSPLLVSALIMVALIIGLIIFMFLNSQSLIRRQKEAFIGGESIEPSSHLSGVDFYNSIKELPILARLYKKAEAKTFDIYEQGKTLVFTIGGFLQYLHNGVLPTYLVWTLLGMIVLFFTLLR